MVTQRSVLKSIPVKPVDDIPILYEELHHDDMGEADVHTRTEDILFPCIEAHVLERRPGEGLRVFSNLNVYYRKKPLQPKTGYRPCVSPDVMIIRPTKPLPKSVVSYTIGKDRPAPLLIVEVLSKRTAKERDLDKKPIIYAKLGIEEYILVDPVGRYLPERLVLKRLRTNGTWKDHRDEDGGVTSQFGFRIVFEEDDRVRVVDAESGYRYLRPDEAEREAKLRHQETIARQHAEQRVRELEAELDKLRKRKNG